MTLVFILNFEYCIYFNLNLFNKSIEDAVRDFALVDRSSIPLLLLVLATRECYTSMKEVNCSLLIDEIESDDILNESHSSF